jgi:general secretion pathway protein L
MNCWLYLTAEGLAAPSTDWPCRVWSALHQGTPMPLNRATEALAGQPVDLLLPMEIGSWVRSEPWPSRRRAQVQAVAFAVEDQLSEPLEHLHLSVGARDGDGCYPVMVIGRERMAEVLKLLAESTITLRSASVDADMLPGTRPLGVLCFGRWLLGGALPARMVLSNEGLKSLQPVLPADIHWLDDDQGDAFFSQCLKDPPAHAINLLQGGFAPRRKALPWRIGALAVFASLLLTWGASEVRIQTVEGQSRQLAQENARQFHTLYPDLPRTLDIAAQLKVLQQQPAQSQSTRISGLLKLVEHVVGASSVEVRRIELRAAEGWKIQLTANSFAELEQLRERGRQQGVPVRLDSANKADDRVHATLTVEDEA